MKTYKYILLDWDGNLAKTLDVWLQATRIPLENRGVKHLSDSEIVTYCFGRAPKGYAELGITDVDAALDEMDAIAVEILPEVELYPDALIVLEKLKEMGKQTALITTSLRKNVIPLLDKYDIHHFFDVVITREDTTHRKPHPEPLEKALKDLGGDKDEAVMIGDSDKDIDAANNAGIDSILFYPDEHAKFYDLKELQAFKPTHTVHDFREILRIV